jgi:hypothetical protein
VIIAVAGCPNPPLLLPGITGRPVAEVEQLRAACLSAIAELLAAGPSRLVIIGSVMPGEPDKPLSLVIGRLLLTEASCQLPVEQLPVAAGSPTADCLAAGRELAARELAAPTERTGLLVMADGSARRSLKAPGYLDPRAAGFDAGVEECLRSGRLGCLAELDPALATQLLVAGRAAWQVLAGAVGTVAGTSRLHYSDDPFGVWYPVLSWRPAS